MKIYYFPTFPVYTYKETIKSNRNFYVSRAEMQNLMNRDLVCMNVRCKYNNNKKPFNKMHFLGVPCLVIVDYTPIIYC